VLRYLFPLSLILVIPCAVLGQDEERSQKEVPPAPADEPDTAAGMSLAEFQSLAFQHNPTLASARARIQAARGKQFQAGRYPNPVVGYHSTVIGNFGTAGMQGGFFQ
jgi:outer membrane protein TolC